MPMNIGRIPAEQCCGLLLAAGQGRRFRQSVGDMADNRLRHGKLLAPLPGSNMTVSQASATTLTCVLERVLAVVPAHDKALQDALRQAGCEIIVHADADQGMGSSLAAGVRALANSTPAPAFCLVALADMPWIRQETIRDLCAASSGAPIVAPVYDMQRGHPVRFHASLFQALQAMHGDEGARSLMRRHPVHLVSCADPGISQDIDTVEQLRAQPMPPQT